MHPIAFKQLRYLPKEKNPKAVKPRGVKFNFYFLSFKALASALLRLS
jgi:hypothetical protein